uniref:Cadherin-13 n=1 Tax=Stegastes partitus TaxID=144197 RepID=A0A3B4Z3T2_9TELE
MLLSQHIISEFSRNSECMAAVQRSLEFNFDDCAGNEDVAFDVSDPSFGVDGDLNLVPRQDVAYSAPVLFVHGVSAHADDMAQVDVTGLPLPSLDFFFFNFILFAQTSPFLPYRSKRSLLVPPMIVTENQRAPFPRIIGRKVGNQIFRLTGPGADQDPKGLFTIDIDTGDVSVSRSLDREAIDSYLVSIELTLACLPLEKMNLESNLFPSRPILASSQISVKRFHAGNCKEAG